MSVSITKKPTKQSFMVRPKKCKIRKRQIIVKLSEARAIVLSCFFDFCVCLFVSVWSLFLRFLFKQPLATGEHTFILSLFLLIKIHLLLFSPSMYARPCVCVSVCLPQLTYGGKRTTCRSCFSSSTLWVPGIDYQGHQACWQSS